MLDRGREVPGELPAGAPGVLKVRGSSLGVIGWMSFLPVLPVFPPESPLSCTEGVAAREKEPGVLRDRGARGAIDGVACDRGAGVD